MSLQLWNPDNTSAPMFENSRDYTDIGEILNYVPYLVWQLTSVMPADKITQEAMELLLNSANIKMQGGIPVEDYEWKAHWLYIGIQMGLSGRFYTTNGGPWTVGMGFDPGFRLECQFPGIYSPGKYFSFSLQTELLLNMDTARYRKPEINASGDIFYREMDVPSFSVSIPLLFKFNFKPERFTIAPYAGASFIMPLGNSPQYTVPLGFIAGLEGGIHMGPGILSLDLRYSQDLGEAVSEGDTEIRYKRNIGVISVGYTFGFFEHKKK
jgi:hypothetical protein